MAIGGRRKNKKPQRMWLIFVSVVVVIAVFFVFKYLSKSDDKSLEEQKIVEQDTEKIEIEPIADFSDYMVMDNLSSMIYMKKEPVRGVYLTAHTAGIDEKLDALIKLADETEINSFVIDVKNDSGYITYDMDLPLVDEIGAEYHAIKDIKVLMDKLYDHNIYPIARIVVFKDPYLSSHKTDYAIKNQDGSLFLYKKVSWLNPYNQNSWKYVIDIAKEAAKSGFKEIQFDYIRFEATYSLESANFGQIDPNKTRMDIITEFLDYAHQELKPYGVEISADVFGTIITSEIDAKMIGQNYVEMAKRLDIICPMVYPSHYGRGYFGLSSSEPPDLHPYEIINGSMEDSNEELAVLENKPIVRPWLQAFTASYLGSGNYMTYDAQAIKDQIQAAYDAGLEEWLLWNPSNRYDSFGF